MNETAITALGTACQEAQEYNRAASESDMVKDMCLSFYRANNKMPSTLDMEEMLMEVRRVLRFVYPDVE